MRLSVSKDDPGYHINATKYRAYLDGKYVDEYITADEEKGYILKYKLDENEKPILKFDYLKTEELYGKVEIKMIRESVKERFPKWQPPEIIHGKPTQYGWVVYHPQNLLLGNFTDIAYGTFINATHGIEIGEGTEIGPYCSILSANTINGTEGRIKIGKGCRIGAYSLILPNVVIGDNVFVKARSILK